MGFRNEIEKIMSYAPKKLQTLCFSATIDSKVKKLAYRYMNNPTIIDITENEESEIPNIKQEVVKTTDRQKVDTLVKILEEDNPFMSIIFCRTKRRADELEVKLAAKGIKAAKIHSDIPQNKREKIMKSFRDCEIQFLIATDVASRGIDVTGVTHIYNYDAPESVKAIFIEQEEQLVLEIVAIHALLQILKTTLYQRKLKITYNIQFLSVKLTLSKKVLILNVLIPYFLAN